MHEDVFGQLGFLGSLVLYASFQGFMLTIYLVWRGSGDKKARLVLAMLVGLMSFHLLDLTLSLTDAFQLAPRFLNNSWPIVFLVGPLYWIYVQRLVHARHGFRWYDLIHFLPAVWVGLDMWTWIQYPVDQRIAYQEFLTGGGEPQLDTGTLLKLAFNVGQNFVYLLLSRRLLSQKEKYLAEVSANNQVLSAMNSLKAFSTGFAAWAGCYLIVYSALVFWGGYGVTIDTVWLFINGLFLQYAALLALTRPEHFAAVVDLVEAEAELETELEGNAGLDADRIPGFISEGIKDDKYRNSSLTTSAMSSHRLAFEKLMDQEKPFLDGALRLADLASQLGISTHNLSQVLNQEVGASFFDVVNQYRVDEAKQLMKDPGKSHLSLLAIAFEAGFNNKNSFNRAFKTQVGLTPSAYLKEVSA